MYCSRCGAWQKWMNKDELRAYGCSIEAATDQTTVSSDNHIMNNSEPMFTKEELKQLYLELQNRSFEISLGQSVDVVKLTDVEDVLINQMK